MKAIAKPLSPVESLALKQEFYKAYRANGGFSYAAAKQIGVDYTTANYWMRNDPNFKELTDSIKGTMLDFAEAELYQRATKLKDRDACLLFYLKTKGKDRGYTEDKSAEQRDGMKVVVEYKTNEADVDLRARIIEEHEANKLLENKE